MASSAHTFPYLRIYRDPPCLRIVIIYNSIDHYRTTEE